MYITSTSHAQIRDQELIKYFCLDSKVSGVGCVFCYSPFLEIAEAVIMSVIWFAGREHQSCVMTHRASSSTVFLSQIRCQNQCKCKMSFIRIAAWTGFVQLRFTYLLPSLASQSSLLDNVQGTRGRIQRIPTWPEPRSQYGFDVQLHVLNFDQVDLSTGSGYVVGVSSFRYPKSHWHSCLTASDNFMLKTSMCRCFVALHRILPRKEKNICSTIVAMHGIHIITTTTHAEIDYTLQPATVRRCLLCRYSC